jgi:hypothetical protein
MVVSGQRHAPGKGSPVPIVQEAVWVPEPVGTQEAWGKVISPLPGIEPRSPGRPARSQTLYWLSYPADAFIEQFVIIQSQDRPKLRRSQQSSYRLKKNESKERMAYKI